MSRESKDWVSQCLAHSLFTVNIYLLTELPIPSSLHLPTCKMGSISSELGGGAMPSPCFPAGGHSGCPSLSNNSAAPLCLQPPPTSSQRDAGLSAGDQRRLCSAQAHPRDMLLALVWLARGEKASDQAVPCHSALPVRVPSGQICLAWREGTECCWQVGEGRKQRCH